MKKLKKVINESKQYLNPISVNTKIILKNDILFINDEITSDEIVYFTDRDKIKRIFELFC